MCGIFGLVDFAGGAVSHRHQIETATDRMAHRGPDGRGIWIDGAVGLGHRRLSIIDPTGSPQPMVSENGRYALTYNGELYNYRELRDELTAVGIVFRTKGDTEVFLNALIYWGVDALVKFNGMFAFGLWDREKQQLLIARDRLGVKPLLYARSGNRFAFASEPPPLLMQGWISQDPNPVGLIAYLAHYQTTFNGQTVYRDIASLDGGEYAIYSQDGFHKDRYWSMPAIPSDEKEEQWPESRFDEASAEIRRLMTAAVKSHSIADVDVGVFLSGGVDSALITTLMCEQSSDRVKAYSIGFAETGFNEFEFSAAVTKSLGLNHHVITMPEEDYFPAMQTLINHKRAPLSTPNEVPIYRLAQVASKDLKVVLTGEGSDELFGGYTGIFRSPHDLEISNILRNSPEKLSQVERTFIRDALRKIYGKSGFRDELDHWTTTYSWLPRSELPQIFGVEFDVKSVLDEIDSVWREKFSRLDGMTTFDRYLYLFETEHLRGLLTRLDACTMAGSLEGRVPFTDNDLIEFAWQLPFHYKLRPRPFIPSNSENRDTLENLDIGKFILKEAFKERLAESITSRTKQAFPVPLESWLNGGGRSTVLGDLTQASAEHGNIFGSGVTEWAERNLATGTGAMRVWMVWNIAKWLNL